MKNFLITIVLISILKPIFPVFEYVINFDYIVSELCKNRDQKDSGCDGKCYLRNQLADVADQDSTVDKNKVQQFDFFFFKDYVLKFSQFIYEIESVYVVDNYNNNYKYLFNYSKNKPPLV